MKTTLTHEEACRLVESAVERGVNTLLYIRAKLDRPCHDGSARTLTVNQIEEIKHYDDILFNINWYGAFLKGVKTMYRVLKEHGFLDIPKTMSGRTLKEDRIVNKALLDLYMESSRNIEWLLKGLPAGVDVATKVEYDKKGKPISAKAHFYKRETIIKML